MQLEWVDAVTAVLQLQLQLLLRAHEGVATFAKNRKKMHHKKQATAQKYRPFARSLLREIPARSKSDARRVVVMQAYVRSGEVSVGKTHTKLNAPDYLGKLIECAKFKRTMAYLNNGNNSVALKLTLASLVKVAVDWLKTGSCVESVCCSSSR
mmetsp:Transcript_46433/g.99022  ORF Transcript_46433/g.99022 Transcript_46433/m.99022 type:complete len:153 (+) Transcript_46433:519-977(+)